MRVSTLHLNFFLAIILELLSSTSGFATSRSSELTLRAPSFKRRFIASTTCYTADPTAAQDTEITVEDKNGKFISVGSIVRVVVDNLKAYQVPAHAYGQFNENKEFVPASTSDESRATRCLRLPAGIRGVVTKIYDPQSSLSANFPIQVKFSPGENTDEGYDPPVPFVMHLGKREVASI